MGFKRKLPITDEVLFLYPAWWRQNVAVAHSYFFKGETFDEMEKIPLGAIQVLCGAIFVGAHFTLLSDFFKKGSVWMFLNEWSGYENIDFSILILCTQKDPPFILVISYLK